jgi:CRP/FNR family transcriptional regulator, cyclic AMP receptor protein
MDLTDEVIETHSRSKKSGSTVLSLDDLVQLDRRGKPCCKSLLCCICKCIFHNSVVVMAGRGKTNRMERSRSLGRSSSGFDGQQQSNQGILSRLPEQLFSSLFRRATTVKVKAEQVLFLVGDNGDGCYRVEDGLLKVTMISRDGNERILAFLGPGAIVGEMSIIDQLPRCASVVAVRASVLSFLDRTNFVNFVKEHSQVYECLLTLLSRRLRETDTTIAAGTFLPLRGRVACTLLELAQEFGQDVGSGRIVIRQKISQKDLAAMAGIARESVSRILSNWKRRKLVTQPSGYYCIENKAHLLNEAHL